MSTASPQCERRGRLAFSAEKVGLASVSRRLLRQAHPFLRRCERHSGNDFCVATTALEAAATFVSFKRSSQAWQIVLAPIHATLNDERRREVADDFARAPKRWTADAQCAGDLLQRDQFVLLHVAGRLLTGRVRVARRVAANSAPTMQSRRCARANFVLPTGEALRCSARHRRSPWFAGRPAGRR